MTKFSIGSLALIATLGLGLVGCTDDDVSGGGYVASGGIIYGDNCYNGAFSYSYGCNGYPGTVIITPGYGGGHGGFDHGHGGGFDHGHDGGFGGGHQGGNPGGGFGGGGMHGGPGGGMGGGMGGHGGHPVAYVTSSAIDTSALTATAAPSEFKTTDTRVQHVAAAYGISEYAATYIVRAIVLAQAKDVSGLTDIGLETSDFAALFQGKDLSDEKLNSLATHLQMPVAATQDLVKNMSTDIKEQQAKQ